MTVTLYEVCPEGSDTGCLFMDYTLAVNHNKLIKSSQLREHAFKTKEDLLWFSINRDGSWEEMHRLDAIAKAIFGD